MPIIRQLQRQFHRAARLGLGRAYLLARAHPNVDFSAEITDVALRNYAYDRQSEGNRADYAFGLYQLVARPQQTRIRRAVLRALASVRFDDTWSVVQLLRLARLLLEHGHAPTTALEAIYRRFELESQGNDDWVGTEEIMALDGRPGLEYIARTYGRQLAANSGKWHDSQLLEEFQGLYPGQDGRALLEQLAPQDADVRRYLDAVSATRRLRAQTAAERQNTPEPSLDELIRTGQPPSGLYQLRKRGLPCAELLRLAEWLLLEPRRAVRENLLYVFGIFKFPLDYRPILAWARQRPNPQEQVVNFAVDALRHLAAPEIRAFALEKLQSTRRPARYTDILVSNYQPGDAALLTRLVERSRSEETIEQLATSYCQVYEANPTPECAAPLLALYEKMTCGIHRRTVVRLLIENDVLPAWLNAELPHDSYADTRQLHQPPT